VGTAQAQELFDLEKVRASGILKVALYKDNAPYSDGKGQDMEGVDVALAHALATEMGLKLSLLPFDAGEKMNDDLRNMVWRGHYLGYGPADVMLHVPVDKFLMVENRQALIFAPYAREVLVIFHALDRLPHLQSGNDLQNLPLAAEQGSGAASTLIGFGGGRLRSQVRMFPTGLLAADAVVRGEAAAAYVSRAQAETALKAAGRPAAGFGLTQLTLPGLVDNGWPIGMAVKSGNRQLAEALESTLQKLRADGRLLAMYRERGLTLVAP
jgi:ABC-type amino acid transport substrate-binding protein